MSDNRPNLGSAMLIEELAQPAWDRVLGLMSRPWSDRLDLLKLADEELRATLHNGERLAAIDTDIRHWESVRDEARRDLVDMDRRKKLAVEKAVDVAAQRAVIGRAKRIDAAREWAEDMQDEQLRMSRRIAVSRLAGAQRELDMRHDTIRTIGTDPLFRDAQTLSWLAGVHGVLQAARKRDRRAHEMVMQPWLQRRAADQALLARLKPVVGDHLVPAAGFAEGALHVVGGTRFALIEIRDGNSELRIDGVNGSRCLRQIRPDGEERPAGAFTGAIAGVAAAAAAASAATGRDVQAIICFLGWDAKPSRIDNTILCGPKLLPAVLTALEEQHVPDSVMATAAAAVNRMQTPLIDVPGPAPLDQFLAVSPDDVPAIMPALRHLIEAAHGRSPERRRSEDLGTFMLAAAH